MILSRTIVMQANTQLNSSGGGAWASRSRDLTKIWNSLCHRTAPMDQELSIKKDSLVILCWKMRIWLLFPRSIFVPGRTLFSLQSGFIGQIRARAENFRSISFTNCLAE